MSETEQEKKRPKVIVVMPARQAAATLRETFSEIPQDEVDEVILLYTDFRSVISLKPVAVRLLPFDMAALDLEGEWAAPHAAGRRGGGSPAYEPDRKKVFEQLVPRAIAMQVWRALLESQASEFAARMTAMDSASRNSKELIGSLTLQSNRIRQAVITKEIAELVGGAEALK